MRTTAPTTRGAVARALGRAALLAAAIAAGPAAREAHAQDQSRGYWATDGCYYAPAQGQWMRVQCRSYDRAGGTWVAQNRSGTFYLVNTRWVTDAQYLAGLQQHLAGLQQLANVEKARAAQQAHRQTTMITVGPPAMSPVEHALRLGDVNAARVLKGIEASNDRAVNTSSHRRCRAGREDQQVPDPGGLQAQSGLEAGVAGWGCAAASLMRATAGPSRTWPDGQLLLARRARACWPGRARAPGPRRRSQ